MPNLTPDLSASSIADIHSAIISLAAEVERIQPSRMDDYGLEVVAKLLRRKATFVMQDRMQKLVVNYPDLAELVIGMRQTTGTIRYKFERLFFSLVSLLERHDRSTLFVMLNEELKRQLDLKSSYCNLLFLDQIKSIPTVPDAVRQLGVKYKFPIVSQFLDAFNEHEDFELEPEELQPILDELEICIASLTEYDEGLICHFNDLAARVALDVPLNFTAH